MIFFVNHKGQRLITHRRIPLVKTEIEDSSGGFSSSSGGGGSGPYGGAFFGSGACVLNSATNPVFIVPVFCGLGGAGISGFDINFDGVIESASQDGLTAYIEITISDVNVNPIGFKGTFSGTAITGSPEKSFNLQRIKVQTSATEQRSISFNGSVTISSSSGSDEFLIAVYLRGDGDGGAFPDESVCIDSKSLLSASVSDDIVSGSGAGSDGGGSSDSGSGSYGGSDSGSGG